MVASRWEGKQHGDGGQAGKGGPQPIYRIGKLEALFYKLS